MVFLLRAPHGQVTIETIANLLTANAQRFYWHFIKHDASKCRTEVEYFEPAQIISPPPYLLEADEEFKKAHERIKGSGLLASLAERSKDIGLVHNVLGRYGRYSENYYDYERMLPEIRSLVLDKTAIDDFDRGQIIPPVERIFVIHTLGPVQIGRLQSEIDAFKMTVDRCVGSAEFYQAFSNYLLQGLQEAQSRLSAYTARLKGIF